jgi:cobalt-zinc-cadmium efflux system membrane fusion protein
MNGNDGSIKMKRLFITVGLFILAGIVMLGCDQGDSDSTENSGSIPVEVMKIELGNVIQSIFYNGDINAEFEVNVFSKIPDRIEKYYIDEGDYIRQGEAIAHIIATTIEQAVRQAEAGVIAAKAQEANLRVEYERAQRLNRENVMSQQQFDLIKTQYEATKAQLEQAEAALASTKSQLKDATVTAPISGIIGKKYFENGDMANMAVPLVKIVQMERLKIIFDAIEEDLGKLANGQQAIVKVRSYPERKFMGKVLNISPILDPITRMADIEVLLDNREHLLKPGMYAEVEVITGVLEKVIVVPRFATIESTTLENINGRDGVVKNYYVFVVDDGIARQKKLEVLYINHINLAVKSGIVVGDTLVVAGQNNLRDGIAVTVANKRGDIL